MEPDERDELPFAEDGPINWASSDAHYSQPGDLDKYADYSEVPSRWRSGTCSVQLLLGFFGPWLSFIVAMFSSNPHFDLLFVFLIPSFMMLLFWWVCVKVLVGDIYYRDRDGEGRLMKWSNWNRAAALLLLVPQIAGAFYLFVTGTPLSK